MGFRTLEISQASEIHIQNGQFLVTSEEGTASVPIEDLAQIMVHGANIRLSTMDLSILSSNKVSFMTLDEKYLPTAVVLPYDGNSRQARVMHRQIETTEDKYDSLWIQIVRQKVSNQARALSIMGLDGAEVVSGYLNSNSTLSIDTVEALAAKEYFYFYHKGLNRRSEDPVNSRLNYGYAVVRSYIARTLVATGFHPTFGIHHNNQLNAFNLADDLIEPFRAMVDLVVQENINSNIQLSKGERKALAGVLHNVCIINNTKMNVMSAVEMMIESLKRIIVDCSSEKLMLPTISPIEKMEGITE